MAVNKFWRLVAFFGAVPAAPEPAPSPAPPPPVVPAFRVSRIGRNACLPLDYKDPARLSRQGRLEASRARDDAEREAAMASAALNGGTSHAR